MPQLTLNYFRQSLGEPLSRIPDFHDGPPKIRFIHILHPYASDPAHHEIQNRTFETIRLAAAFATPSVRIDVICVTLQSESALVPKDFSIAEPLKRTVNDIAEFSRRRQLPLVFDILEHGVASVTSAEPGWEDYIIWTNIDIHVQPYFYLTVAKLVESGYDTINIFRRTIEKGGSALTDLALQFADHGSSHPGVDCLVFPRHVTEHFVRNDACVGILFVMRALVWNLAAHAKRYLVLTNAHITFHVGDDRQWSNPEFKDYESFNFKECKRVLLTLARDRIIAAKLATIMRASQEHHEYIWKLEDAAGIPGKEGRIFRFNWRIYRRILGWIPAAIRGRVRKRFPNF